jgi:hypothetical protein
MLICLNILASIKVAPVAVIEGKRRKGKREKKKRRKKWRNYKKSNRKKSIL